MSEDLADLGQPDDETQVASMVLHQPGTREGPKAHLPK